MAYNNGFPMAYQPYNNISIPGQNMGQSYAQQVPQNFPGQSGGFIPVPSEDVARNYPVGPGNSVTFKNENAPYIYTKTMGFSQLDRPIFEKYKLVREDESREELTHLDNSGDFEKLTESVTKTNDDLDKLRAEVEDLRSQLEDLRIQVKRSGNSRKKDEVA